MDCTAAADQLGTSDLALIVICALILLGLVLRVVGWIVYLFRYRGTSTARTLHALQRGTFTRAMLRTALGGDRDDAR